MASKINLRPPVPLTAVRSKAVVLLLFIHCLLLLQLFVGCFFVCQVLVLFCSTLCHFLFCNYLTRLLYFRCVLDAMSLLTFFSSSLPCRVLVCSMFVFFVCFFVVFFLFDYLRPSQQSFSYVETGLPGLNQYLARINVSCSRTQGCDAEKGQYPPPFGLESNTLPLNHCTPVCSL